MLTDNDVWAREPDRAAVAQAHKLLKVAPKSAITELERLAARGSIMSMLYLGSAYCTGKGVAKDTSNAENWFREGAARGSIFASHELGLLYLKSNKHQEAFELFSACAENDYGPSLHRLGNLYLQGQGVPKDVTKAKTLIEAAIFKGNIMARRTFGLNLIKGTFGRREVAKGIVTYLRAFPLAVATALKSPYSERLRG